jgi:acyl-CoA synthetase (NDP forming)
VTVDALFRQSGVIRTETLEELFSVASLLANQTLPRGRGVGIVTNVGGPAILCADACEAQGLHVPELSDETRRRLRAFLPSEASVGNPVDMIASASADNFRAAIEIVAADPSVDAVIMIFIPPLATRSEDVARATVEATRALNGSKPVLAVFMSSRGVPAELRAAELLVPSYAFPEMAAIALAHAVRYGEWRSQPTETPPVLSDTRPDEAAAVVAAALGRGDGWLEPAEVHRLLGCYGLSVATQAIAATPEEAATMAAQIGPEVALKAVAPGVVHKTEMGAVRLGLRGAQADLQAAREMERALAAARHAPRGYVVQEMVPRGVEMIVGIVHDPQFGPVVACGAGGTLVELLKDVQIRLTPLARRDASEMLRSLKTYPLLAGFRGSQPCDLAALEDALLRVSALAEDLPQVVELDLNPIVAHQQGAVVVDARVRVQAVAPPRPMGARR